VTLALLSSTNYDIGFYSSGTLNIQDTPFNTWRLQNFGASANAPNTTGTADWTGDGIKNLVAFGLGINPVHPTPAMLPAVSIVSHYLTLSYMPNPGATDVTYSVEATTDLIHWSTSNVQSVSNPPPNTVVFRYAQPTSVAPEVFLRLRVTPLD